MSWKIVYTKQAQKDLKKIASSILNSKVIKLFKILEKILTKQIHHFKN